MVQDYEKLGRIFSLKNAIGQEINLRDTNTLAYKPEELGVAFENEYGQTGANFLIAGTNLSMQKIKFTMVFGHVSNRPYDTFREFVEFLDYPDYTLTYITSAGSYERDCKLNMLGKTEIDEWGLLQCEFVLDAVTPWYQYVTTSSKGSEPTPDGGKIYGLRTREYVYELSQIGEANNIFDFNNDSIYLNTTFTSPLEVTITATDGACTNPFWELFQGGQVVQSDGVFGTILQDEKLIVSSFPQDQRVVRISGGIPINQYASIDLTKTNFVTIPKGRSTLIFYNTLNAKVQVRARYEKVVV